MDGNEQYLETILAIPGITSAYLSPDGRWAAFPWVRRRPQTEVFAVRTDGRSSPRMLGGSSAETQFISWGPGSDCVVLAEDECGDERARLYRVFLEKPSFNEPLTEAKPDYYIRGGSLSLNGGNLYYGANYDFETGKAQEPTWIYQHDLNTGRRNVLARPNKPGWNAPYLNLQGTQLLYSSQDQHSAGRQFHLLDLATRVDEEIQCADGDCKVFARWFQDGVRILLLAEAFHNGLPYQRVGIYNFKDKCITWLVDDHRRAIQSAWPTRDGDVVLHEIKQARAVPVLYRMESRDEAQFPTVEGNLIPLGTNHKGEWVGLHYHANRPENLVRFRWGQKAARPARQTFQPLSRGMEPPGVALAPAEAWSWRSTDGMEIHGWFYRARVDHGRAVVYIHGGPSMHMEERLHPLIQYLTWRGFHVLAPNYRGSTGYGTPFQRLIREDGWGGREMDDILTGIQKMIREGLAKPGRVGLTGTSYGGYACWRLATSVPLEWVSAIAPVCGMTDLVLDYQTTRPDLRRLSAEMMGGTPEEIPQRYFERSPIHFIHNLKARVLVVQGANDPNVTNQNVTAVRMEMDRYGIDYQLLEFKDEGHGIRKPANLQVLYHLLGIFFEEALGREAGVGLQGSDGEPG